MTEVLLSVGSNQNNPQEQISMAVEALKAKYNRIALSTLYDTEPVGPVDQDAYVNAAVRLETEDPATEVLKFLLSLEQKAKRNRAMETPKGPRNLDLDIILYGDEIRASDSLTLPHPRFRERRFVLEPLCEIAPLVQDPMTGKSIQDLLANCGDTSWVKPCRIKATRS